MRPPQPDVSVIINTHRGGAFLATTLTAICRAIAFAQAQGLSCEVILVWDRAEQGAVSAFDALLAGFECPLMTVHVDCGSPGPARQAGVLAATGQRVALCDGDDIISYNFLAEMHREAAAGPEKIVVTPEWVMGFGDFHYFGSIPSLASISPLALLELNPFVATLFARREPLLGVPFSVVEPESAYAFEDWHFNCELVARGFDFRPAPGTILFYRKHQASLISRMNSMSTQQIAPSSLFEPAKFMSVCKRAYLTRRDKGSFSRRSPSKGRSVFLEGGCVSLIEAAHAIEPGITFEGLYHGSEYHPLAAANLSIGICYYELCRTLGDGYSDIFIVDRICESLFVSAALIENALIISESAILEPLEIARRQNVKFTSLAAHLPQIGETGADLIVLKLVQNMRADGTIHVFDCGLAHRFREKFSRAVSNAIVVHS